MSKQTRSKEPAKKAGKRSVGSSRRSGGSGHGVAPGAGDEEAEEWDDGYGTSDDSGSADVSLHDDSDDDE